MGSRHSLGAGPPSSAEERMGFGGCRTELRATPKSFTGRGSPGNVLRCISGHPSGASATKVGLGRASRS